MSKRSRKHKFSWATTKTASREPDLKSFYDCIQSELLLFKEATGRELAEDELHLLLGWRVVAVKTAGTTTGPANDLRVAHMLAALFLGYTPSDYLTSFLGILARTLVGLGCEPTGAIVGHMSGADYDHLVSSMRALTRFPNSCADRIALTSNARNAAPWSVGLAGSSKIQLPTRQVKAAPVRSPASDSTSSAIP